MKKILLTALSLLLTVCLFAFGVSAETDVTTVYVTIADNEGNLVLSAESISLNGQNPSIHEVLKTAHEIYYKNGAEEGYSASETAYGLSMNKLWGIDGNGSYGYCVNNVPATNLNDTVKYGDHIYAYIYSDTVTFSDSYSYFDIVRTNAEKGGTLTLTLSHLTYDENWNTVTSPVANATILLNGEKTALRTDENGIVTVPCEKSGKTVVSAEHSELTLVPPVCLITIPSDGTVIILTAGILALLLLAVGAFLFIQKRKKTAVNRTAK